MADSLPPGPDSVEDLSPPFPSEEERRQISRLFPFFRWGYITGFFYVEDMGRLIPDRDRIRNLNEEYDRILFLSGNDPHHPAEPNADKREEFLLCANNILRDVRTVKEGSSLSQTDSLILSYRQRSYPYANPELHWRNTHEVAVGIERKLQNMIQIASAPSDMPLGTTENRKFWIAMDKLMFCLEKKFELFKTISVHSNEN